MWEGRGRRRGRGGGGATVRTVTGVPTIGCCAMQTRDELITGGWLLTSQTVITRVPMVEI